MGMRRVMFFRVLDIMSCTASILHLCVISVDRYMAIVHPMTYPVKMTRKLSLVLICAVWCLSLCLSFPWLFFLCMVSKCATLSHPALRSSSLPPIMIILYAKMFLTAQAHTKRVLRGRMELSDGSHEAMRIHRGGAGMSRSETAINTEYKAAKTIGLVIGAFLICWLPFFTVNIIRPWCIDNCETIYIAFIWLGFVNSAINPFIYTFTNSSSWLS